MGYYDVVKNCDSYTKMAEGFDGREHIEFLRTLLPSGTVLELGMGPGTDLDILAEFYDVIGSDASQVFVDQYAARHPAADVRVIDAVSFAIDDPVDAIFSNKVLYHMYPDELAESLQRQARSLPPDGIMLHTLWHGEPRTDEGQGLLFTYYDFDALRAVIPSECEIVDLSLYRESAVDDSIRIVLKKTQRA